MPPTANPFAVWVERYGLWGWLVGPLGFALGLGSFFLAAGLWEALGRPLRTAAGYCFYSSYYVSCRDMSGHGAWAAVVLLIAQVAIVMTAGGTALLLARVGSSWRGTRAGGRTVERLDRAKVWYADGRIDEATYRRFRDLADAEARGGAVHAMRSACSFLRWFWMLLVPIALLGHIPWLADSAYGSVGWVRGQQLALLLGGVVVSLVLVLFAVVRWAQVAAARRRMASEREAQLDQAEDAVVEAARKTAPVRAA